MEQSDSPEKGRSVTDLEDLSEGHKNIPHISHIHETKFPDSPK